jgi:hypothetical protein
MREARRCIAGLADEADAARECGDAGGRADETLDGGRIDRLHAVQQARVAQVGATLVGGVGGGLGGSTLTNSTRAAAAACANTRARMTSALTAALPNWPPA